MANSINCNLVYSARLAVMTIFLLACPALAAEFSDGLYLVERQNFSSKSLEPLAATEGLIQNDFHLLEPLEREKPIYLVVKTDNFIPLVLNGKPIEDKEDGTGKPRLRLDLAPSQIKPLENFTRVNLGKTVAVIIGGDVVSTHKIKSVITGGQLQIVRCTKHGCETLFTKLLKDKTN